MTEAAGITDEPLPAQGDTTTADEQAWLDLADELADLPTGGDTMPVIEGRLRRLFDLMVQVGLWHNGKDGLDPLHQALRKHAGVQHVGELRKDGLVDLAAKSWAAARASAYPTGPDV